MNARGDLVADAQVSTVGLIDPDMADGKEFEEKIYEKLAPHNFMPIIFTSVLTKQRVHKAIEKVIEVYENKRMKIPTSKLNEVMLAEI